MKLAITVPLSQTGEAATDLNDLWAQLGTGRERFAITVKKLPSPQYTVTVNGRSI
jgi:hypothetical protein